MLQALELFGFKSFADKTRFDFAPGITCVVGPNGSGKSNVVDAIKWILGDQSPKSLRGKEMTDVIFNGSASRKPAGFAEAMLTFDNSRRVLQVDADEVVIGRRIYRSGEAEYLINRIPARLKDVKDLFLGTGAGTAAYSIIEQGRVDQLLQASNSSRRVVFEEAAGISRYKLRKVDAERKLERVAQNLLRLTDIVKEVETRLTSTRNQATKAAKYREYSQELKALRAGSAADDYRQSADRLAHCEHERQTFEARANELGAAAAEFEAWQRSAEARLTETEDHLRDVEQRGAQHRELQAGHEATLKHLGQRLEELDDEYKRLDLQQQDLAARAEEVVGELQQTDADLGSYADELARRQAEFAAFQDEANLAAQELDRLRAAREAYQAELLSLVREISTLTTRAAGLQAQVDQQESSRLSLDEHSAVLAQQLASAQAEHHRLQSALEAATAEFQRARTNHSELQTRRATLHAEQVETQQGLAELREQRGSLLARKSLLEEFERRIDGTGIGAKEILALASKSGTPPWNHVVGHVIDLVECDLENAALLEVALGQRAQLLVLDDAEPLLSHIRTGDCRINGRVGFLILPAGTPPVGDQRLSTQIEHYSLDLSEYVDVVCRADALLKSAGGVAGLGPALLADTWIVRTLDAAAALLPVTGGRCRFVTLQGELLESNGTLYVGSLSGESAGISRKSELRAIKNDLARGDRQIAAAEKALVDLRLSIGKLVEDDRQAQFDLDLAAHHLAELRTTCGSAHIAVQRLEQQYHQAQSDAGAIRQRLDELAPNLSQAVTELRRAETAQEELQLRVETVESELATTEARLRESQLRVGSEQRELARFEERLQSLRQSRSRLDHERFQRELQHDEADRRFQTLAARRAQIEQEMLRTESALAELSAQGAALHTAISEAQAAREQARSGRGDLAEKELSVRHELRTVQEALHNCQMKTAELKHQRTSIADRLRDEFQMEIDEALAAGLSARQILRDSVSHDESGGGEDGPGDAANPGGSGPDPERQQIEDQINRLRRKIKQLGQVNVESLKELDELEERFGRLSGQLQDLLEAKATLEEIIRKINTESRRIFLDCFDAIRKNFQELFRKLFGGGEGDVILENPEDVLECGIDVVARPPGKELRSISLLSGGEKTMTAVALLLAIFKSRPSPFCILDEVDAALDEGNVNRYLNVLKEFQEWTQFIVVTHNKRTMSGAQVLYGVTMEEAGISKRMSVRFEDISEDGHFKAAA